MMTVIGIILADVLLFVFYVCQYRQELGLSVNGSHDVPVPRRKPAPRPAPSPTPNPPPSSSQGPPPIRGRPFTFRP
jgi:hypothetical protein